jgi:hypothetical protein
MRRGLPILTRLREGRGFGYRERDATPTLASVSGGDALTATLVYGLVGYSLPRPAGGIGHLLFRRRYVRLPASGMQSGAAQAL